MTTRKPLDPTMPTERALLCVAALLWEDSNETISDSIAHRDESEDYSDAVAYAGACLIEEALEHLGLDRYALMDDRLGEVQSTVCEWIEEQTEEFNPANADEDADPTPYCNACGAMTEAKCKCGALAAND